MRIDEQLILAGDVGGTKSYLALFDSKNGLGAPIAQGLFQSSDFTSFVEMVGIFLQKYSLQPTIASIGVAGPVLSGAVNISKLRWQITEPELKKALGVREAILLNDLVAIGHSIPFLGRDDLSIIHKGIPDDNGVIIVVAPGTGLGETFITWNGGTAVIHPSEGGHSLFAPGTPLHTDLLRYARKIWGQVTYDLLCSGGGISLIYDFLRERTAVPEPEWLTTKLQQSTDRTPVIVEAGKDNPLQDQIAHDTIEIFVEILASECANFTLKTLASGGVYVAGGIPPRIQEFLKEKPFMATFANNVPLRSYLEKIPVTMITNPQAALLGAASVGLRASLK